MFGLFKYTLKTMRELFSFAKSMTSKSSVLA